MEGAANHQQSPSQRPKRKQPPDGSHLTVERPERRRARKLFRESQDIHGTEVSQMRPMIQALSPFLCVEGAVRKAVAVETIMAVLGAVESKTMSSLQAVGSGAGSGAGEANLRHRLQVQVLNKGAAGVVSRLCWDDASMGKQFCTFVMKSLTIPTKEHVPFVGMVHVDALHEMDIQNYAAMSGFAMPVMCHIRHTTSKTELLCMQGMFGLTLEAFLKSPRQSFDSKLRICHHVVTVVRNMHSHGIFHNDLHTGNIFVLQGQDASAKIMDFGRSVRMADRERTPPLGRIFDACLCVASMVHDCPQLVAHAQQLTRAILGTQLDREMRGEDTMEDTPAYEAMRELGIVLGGDLAKVRPSSLPEHPHVKAFFARMTTLLHDTPRFPVTTVSTPNGVSLSFSMTTLRT